MPTRPAVRDEARDSLRSPLVDLDDERQRLERALAELGDKATDRAPGRPRGFKASSTAQRAGAVPGKRRKRCGGTRADQAVKLIEQSPGIGASDLAKAMKIKPNHLYRVLAGRVKKEGRHCSPGG